MGDFARGLGPDFVNVLNRAYQQKTWWSSMLDDPDIYLGIRNRYLNLYYKGNSLVRLNCPSGTDLSGCIHYKYLVKPDASPYVTCINDNLVGTALGADYFLQSLTDPTLLKRATEPYAGVEKSGVHEILRSNWNVIDVEIGITDEDDAVDDASRPGAQRIDFAALVPAQGRVNLVFYEAKHFGNGELRANGDGTPMVLQQIEKYKELLSAKRSRVEEAYRTVCSELARLEGAPEDLKGLAKQVESGVVQFSLDPEPRLVIFGFDEDQKRGAVWGRHRKKLMNVLGSRLLLKGDPKGMRKGISR
ncbi:MAG: hypothetical protein SCH98_15265 [Deferrisomatales bacterium]|nr:hypothetical protein [Deferrisomatales bacterium]